MLLVLGVLSIWGFRLYFQLNKIKSEPLLVNEMNFMTDHILDYNSKYNPDYISHLRHYTEYYLYSDIVKNSKILQDARIQLNYLKASKDTINGIHITISDSTSIQDFVTATDICSESFPAIYGVYKNQIWAFYQFIDTLKTDTDKRLDL